MTPPIISLFDLAKIMKDNKDLFFHILFSASFNNAGNKGVLKHADI